MNEPDRAGRLLVVAGPAAESGELLEALVERSRRQAVELTLIVPSTEAGGSPKRRDAGAEAARVRLRGALARFRAAGLYVREATVAEGDAARAVADAAGDVDEIVVATPPRRPWRRRDTLGERLHHATGLPVTQVVGRLPRGRHAEPAPSRAARRSSGPERRRGRPPRRRAAQPARPSQAWVRSREPVPAPATTVRLNLARGLALLGFVLLALGVAGAT